MGDRWNKPFIDALKQEIAAAGDDNRELRHVAKALLRSAKSGYLPAIEVLADRLDGKVKQTISGDPERPLLVHAITRVIIDAGHNRHNNATQIDGSAAPQQIEEQKPGEDVAEEPQVRPELRTASDD